MGYHFPFGLRHFFHIIVESGNSDTSVGIRYFANNLAKRVDRIGYRTPEMSGMQVTIRSRHFYFPISQPAQTSSQ